MTSIDLELLNSATKYPSIPTYHTLDPKSGSLLEPAIDFGDAEIHATEKVDGTNARIIFTGPGDYYIGSREEILYARGDRVINPALGIAETLIPIAEAELNETLNGRFRDENDVTTLYLEVYGHKIGAAAKNYTATPGARSARLFDIGFVDMTDLRTKSRAEVSAWREAGGQYFAPLDVLGFLTSADHLTLVPYLEMPRLVCLPQTLEGMHGLLKDLLPQTAVSIDGTGAGRSEGVVFRSADRSVVAKARFADYERTFRRQAVGKTIVRVSKKK